MWSGPQVAAADNVETQIVDVMRLSPPLQPPPAIASPNAGVDERRSAYQGRGKDLSTTLDQMATPKSETPLEGGGGGTDAVSAEDAASEAKVKNEVEDPKPDGGAATLEEQVGVEAPVAGTRMAVPEKAKREKKDKGSGPGKSEEVFTESDGEKDALALRVRLLQYSLVDIYRAQEREAFLKVVSYHTRRM